ncbi:MAG: BTAD domain-containing putative transcriptional regulator [Ilumatobacteraceae bacterium]
MVERVRQRFVADRIVVSAGAGFGKSCLIDQALADNRVRPAGLDLRIDLDGRLRSQVAFADALMRSARLMSTGDVDHDVTRLVAWLIAQSPLDVCLVLDDVHELDGAPAADLLARLAPALPANAHLLLVGRDLSAWSVDGVPTIGEDDLAFTPDEIDAIARSADVDPAVLAAFAGWPAITAAVALGRPAVAIDFALEEVFEQLPPDVRRAVALLGVARRLPAEVLVRLMPSLSVESLVARVPLVERRDGDVIGHELWRDAARMTVDTEVVRELVAALVEHRRFEEAVEVAQRSHRWADADAAVLALVASRVHGVPADLCRRLTEGVPARHTERPGHRLLCAIAASHDRGAGRSSDHDVAALLALADEFEPGDGAADRATATVRTVLGVAVAFAWIARDVVAVDAVARRVAACGLDADDWLVLVSHGFADIVHGRAADAERRLLRADDRGLPRDVRPLVVRVLVTLLGVSGDIEALRALDIEVLRSSPDSHVRQVPMVVAWLSGDVDGVVPWRTMLPDDGRQRGDQLTQVFFHAAVRVSWGDTADLEDFAAGVVAASPDDRGAIACRRALAAAVVAVGLGDEPEAARLLADAALDPDVTSDSLPLRELGRALCYPYVLVPGLRPRLDGLAHGLYQRHRDIARWLVELRAGRVPQGRFPEAEHIFLAMPLAWSCELARLAGAAGVGAGDELAHWLRSKVGSRAVDLLADQADGADGQVASGSDVVAGDDVRLTWLGSAKVDHGAPELAAAAAPEWRRARVRQLLAILALRRRIARSDLAEWLWPDRAPAQAASNLRVTLTYARRVLGDLAVDTRRRVLIDTAGVLELVPHRRIGVDLWEYEAAVADADQAERRGDIEAAAVALDRAFGFWGGRPLVDLEYDDRAAPQLQALRADLCRSAVRCGELRLARGDVRGALETVESVLDLDPAWEPAHRLAIAVAARSGGHVTRACPRAVPRCARRHRPHSDADTQVAQNLAGVDTLHQAEVRTGRMGQPRRVRRPSTHAGPIAWSSWSRPVALGSRRPSPSPSVHGRDRTCTSTWRSSG